MESAMHTLFGTRGSGSAAAEAALALAAVEFTSVDAASWEAGPGRDELRRVNSLCQIPTLVLPDGSVLTESAAILIHLGLAHSASGLLPAGAAERAQAIRGLVYVAANCYAAIGVIDFPERWCTDTDEATAKRIKAGSTQRLHYRWEVVADTFPARPFLGGPHIGALDVLAAVVSKWSGSRKHLASARPAFSALLARIESEPRVAPVFARHWPPA
jgi:GST-like protein